MMLYSKTSCFTIVNTYGSNGKYTSYTSKTTCFTAGDNGVIIIINDTLVK